MKYNLVDIAEEIAQEGYNIGLFACKFFYQESKLESLKNCMDDYIVNRFSQRLEYFAYEHSKISDKEKKEFYNDLVTNNKNLNYLYEFIENARRTTYEMQAKFLARLSVELIRNKTLQYQEAELINIVLQLNDMDFLSIKNNLILPENATDRGYFEINKTTDYFTYKKCIKLQVFDEMTKENFRLSGIEKPTPNYEKNIHAEYAIHSYITQDFMRILNEI